MSTTPLLAGVATRLAGIFGFNVWVLRAIFVLLLLTKTLVAVVVYGLLALAFQLADRYRGVTQEQQSEKSPAASSPVSDHNHELAELDRRFREWEDSLTR